MSPVCVLNTLCCALKLVCSTECLFILTSAQLFIYISKSYLNIHSFLPDFDDGKYMGMIEHSDWPSKLRLVCHWWISLQHTVGPDLGRWSQLMTFTMIFSDWMIRTEAIKL